MGYYSDQEQKQIIADNLAHLVAQKGKDQKQIAIDLDVNPQTFNQWYRGVAIPSVSKLKELASYFNVSLVNIVDPPDAPSRTNASLVKLTDDEVRLITAYQQADDLIKTCVLKMLDLK